MKNFVDQELLRVPNPFINALMRNRVSDVKQPTSVKFLRSWNSMLDLMIALHTEKVMSFPVLDEDDECLGIVDGVDLVQCVNKNSSASTPENVFAMSVETFINASNSNPYIPVFSTTSLLAVISILAPGCHRTIIFNNECDYSLYGMFSETDLIAFITSYIEKSENPDIKRVASLPIHAFSGSISHPVHVAHYDDLLSTSFRSLVEFRLGNAAGASASSEAGEIFEYSTPIVAIVDNEEHIIGHLSAENMSHSSNSLEQVQYLHDVQKSPADSVSAEDLVSKNVSQTELNVLNKMLRPLEMKTGEYIELYAPESLKFWIVPETISMFELFKIFVENHLHHVWVASTEAVAFPQRSDEAKPIDKSQVRGVLTLTDALRWLARDNLWLKASRVPQNHF